MYKRQLLEKYQGREHELRQVLQGRVLQDRILSESQATTMNENANPAKSHLDASSRNTFIASLRKLDRAGILSHSADILAEQFYAKGEGEILFSSLLSRQGGTEATSHCNHLESVTAALKDNNTLDFTGKRELIDEKRAAELFQGLNSTHLGRITNIVLGTKSFDVPSAKVAAGYLKQMSSLRVADLSDIIAGRETSIGLEVLETVGKALLPPCRLQSLDVSENALGPRGIRVLQPLLCSQPSLQAISFMNDGLSAEACEEIHRLVAEGAAAMHSEGLCKLRKLIFHNNMSGDGGCLSLIHI